MSRPTSVLVLGAVLLASPALQAQNAPSPELAVVPGYYTAPHYFSPVDALASRVHAQADIVRARSDAAVNHAIARRIRADARSREFENWVGKVRTLRQLRVEGEAERFRRAFHYLDHKDRVKAQQARQIIDHPDLAGPAIARGKTLNVLLNLLSSGAVAFQTERSYDELSPAQRHILHIRPNVLDSIWVKRSLPNGEQEVFRAITGKPLDVDWWPYALRDEYFQPHRAAFLTARDRVMHEADVGEISQAALRHLYGTFADLSADFDAHYDWRRRHRQGMRSWSHYKKAADFLESLYGEIRRLETTGDIRTLEEGLRFQPRPDGSGDLIALLNFMSRNGLEFAPAKPNDESAYHSLFQNMRKLYIAFRVVPKAEEGNVLEAGFPDPPPPGGQPNKAPPPGAPPASPPPGNTAPGNPRPPAASAPDSPAPDPPAPDAPAANTRTARGTPPDS